MIEYAESGLRKLVQQTLNALLIRLTIATISTLVKWRGFDESGFELNRLLEHLRSGVGRDLSSLAFEVGCVSFDDVFQQTTVLGRELSAELDFFAGVRALGLSTGCLGWFPKNVKSAKSSTRKVLVVMAHEQLWT